VLLSGRFRLRLVSHRGRLADTTEFAESGAQSFPLRRKPVSFSMRFLVPTFGPEVTGTFADRFSISCISFSVQGPLPQREIASGSPDVLFRPFESKSMTFGWLTKGEKHGRVAVIIDDRRNTRPPATKSFAGLLK